MNISNITFMESSPQRAHQQHAQCDHCQNFGGRTVNWLIAENKDSYDFSIRVFIHKDCASRWGDLNNKTYSEENIVPYKESYLNKKSKDFDEADWSRCFSDSTKGVIALAALVGLSALGVKLGIQF